jgi:hypothetical protein
MKLYSSETSMAVRPEILRSKHMYGIWFGVALGLTFAIFAWGIDAFLLNRMNGLHSWLKFLGGVIPCVIVGGVTGWLSARLDKPLLAMLLWGAAAAVFGWLTVSLPLQIAPRILSLAEPGIQDLLHYMDNESFSTRFGVSYFWIATFVGFTGLLQIPLSDSAVFSTSPLGKILPILVTLVLMGICGTTLDGLNNGFLRSSVDVVNRTIQFTLDNRGKEIEPAVSRRMHLGALRGVENLITPERKFIVSSYDPVLEQVQILARFDQAWVDCEMVVDQLVNCEQVGNPR